jgi:hypothetical protein
MLCDKVRQDEINWQLILAQVSWRVKVGSHLVRGGKSPAPLCPLPIECEYEAFIDHLVPGVQNKGKILIKSIPIG